MEKQESNEPVYCCSGDPAPLIAVGLTARPQAAFENVHPPSCSWLRPVAAQLSISPGCILSSPLTSPPVLFVTISLVIHDIQRIDERVKS